MKHLTRVALSQMTMTVSKTEKYESEIVSLKKKIKDLEKEIDSISFFMNSKIVDDIIIQSPWPIWILNKNGILVDMNSACEDLLDINKSEFIGKYDVYRDSLLIRQGIINIVKDVITKKKPQRHLVRYNQMIKKGNKEKGELLTLEGLIHPILNKQGEIEYFVGQFIDITEQKKLEDKLLENQIKYRTVADFTYDWEEWILPNGQYEYISPACERITGYTWKEIKADPDLFFSMVNKDDISSVLEHYKSKKELHPEMDDLEFRIITKYGEEKWIHHKCQAVYDSSNNYLGRRISNRDVTQRKKAEIKIKKLNLVIQSLSTDINENIDHILDSVNELIEGSFAVYNRFGTTQDALIRYSSNYNKTKTEKFSQLMVKSCMEAILDDKEDITVFDSFHRSIPENSPLIENNIQSFLGSKIKLNNKCIGTLCLISESSLSYTETDIYILSTLGKMLSNQEGQIEFNSILNESREVLNKRAIDLEIINSLNEIVHADQSLDEIKRILIDKTIDIYPPHGILITDYNKQDDILSFDLSNMGPKFKSYLKKIFGSRILTVSSTLENIPIIQDVIRQQKSKILYGKDELENLYKYFSPVSLSPLLLKGLHKLLKLNYLLLVPLVLDGETLGILNLALEHKVGKTDIIRLERLAKQIAQIFGKVKAQNELIKSEEKYRNLIENSSEAIVIVQDGVFKYCNSKAAELLAVPPKEVINKSFLNYIEEKKQSKLLEKYEKTIRGIHGKDVFETVLVNENNVHIPVELKNSLILYDNNRNAIMSIVLDLRIRIQAEKDRIYHQVQKEKLKSMNTMATSIAHNFNNHLQSIVGGLEFAKEETDENSRAFKMITMAEKAVDDAIELNKFMLTYVGYSRGRTSVFNLNDILSEEKAHLNFGLPKNIDIHFKLSEENLQMNGDAPQIKTLNHNIFKNAIEACTVNGGSITIESHLGQCDIIDANYMHFDYADLKGECIILKIRDTGIGMDQDTIKNIFDPYFSTKFTGRGLGMAVVQGIVRSHKGAIKVESEPRVGTIVTMYFPLHKK